MATSRAPPAPHQALTPINHLVGRVKTIGIFEAKTHFPSLCTQVAQSGASVLVQRRGRPLVMISPAAPLLPSSRKDIWSAWKEWEAQHPSSADAPEFPEVWTQRQDRSRSPLME